VVTLVELFEVGTWDTVAECERRMLPIEATFLRPCRGGDCGVRLGFENVLGTEL